VVSRTEWGARAARGTYDPVKRELFIHHTVSAGTFSTLAEQKAHMRALDLQHINQGWSGIGYSFVVFPATKWYKRTRIFEGRGWDWLPAAQANHNTGTIAVSVVGNYDVKKPGRRLVFRLAHFARRARKRKGIRVIRGHRDVMATGCPGANLYAKLPRIRQLSGLS
jgi:hypothetical protein